MAKIENVVSDKNNKAEEPANFSPSASEQVGSSPTAQQQKQKQEQVQEQQTAEQKEEER
jgi:hypothetical protein